MDAEEKSLLWDIVEEISRWSDGHFTLMRFTTHWKAMFFTPDFNSRAGRERIASLRAAATKEKAILFAVHDFVSEKINS